MPRRPVVLLVLAAVSAVGAPASATVRDLGPASASTNSLLTDGTRYLAVAAKGQAAVHDLVTGRRSVRANPPRCSPTAIGAAQLVYDCDLASSDARDSPLAAGKLMDLRTGSVRDLPVINRGPQDAIDDISYSGIGLNWLRVTRTGYHTKTFGYHNRTTGAALNAPDTYRLDTDNRLTPDLNASNPVRTLCEPMRRLNAPDPSAIGLAPGELSLFHGRAASVRFEGTGNGPPKVSVVLQQCGSKARVVRSCSDSNCSNVVLGARIIAWVESLAGGYSVVHVRALLNGRPRGATRTLTRATAASIALVRGRLFIVTGGRLLEFSF